MKDLAVSALLLAMFLGPVLLAALLSGDKGSKSR